MAIQEHLTIFRKGVSSWNNWRISNPSILPDLSDANLAGCLCSHVNFHGVNLNSADLSNADLTEASLEESLLGQAYLSNTCFDSANLKRAVLSNAYALGASFNNAELQGAMLSGTKLHAASFKSANLKSANLGNTTLEAAIFQKSCLENADLFRAQALGTDFRGATLTGAHLREWHINNETKLENVTCQYAYVDVHRPNDRKYFAVGEFTEFFYQALDTVDLIFKDGIDWPAFFQAFQNLRNQYVNQDFAIQAIEKKRGSAFVVRLEVTQKADKSAIEHSMKELYKEKLVLMKKQYKAELNAKESEIIAYREHSANLMKITEMLASTPNIQTNILSNSNTIKNLSKNISVLNDGVIKGGIQATIGNDNSVSQSVKAAGSEHELS